MNKILIILFFFSAFKISAQSEEELFSLIEGETSVEPSLLPKRMIFTQRFFWGERGVLRSTGLAPLNKQKREKELKLRRVMLTTHQTLGYATLLAMIAQGIIGGKLYNGQSDLYETHKAMGKIVNIGYFTGAGLSLLSPPPLINKKVKGLNSIKAHKFLATIHFSAMLSTNYFSDKDRGAHKASAYTAFASFATAVLVFKF
ncbi:MAG: hypothetical protein CMC79_01465 [Flavobacteriaceae bacterium]|nr:hypothetical protein [Flavobacteriaceae bacterium]|tara:strand:+ start:9334 stop:9936 length:603 start_codon:yes stop_codon:yes gene_type:complete